MIFLNKEFLWKKYQKWKKEQKIYGGIFDAGKKELEIQELKKKDVKYYDFVGARINTKDTRLLGIQRFKSRFGATFYGEIYS